MLGSNDVLLSRLRKYNYIERNSLKKNTATSSPPISLSTYDEKLLRSYVYQRLSGYTFINCGLHKLVCSRVSEFGNVLDH